jgi:2'-5' RNA ligase
VRAFLGIAIPPEGRGALARLEEALGRSGADVKWVAPAHLHVTLKFLDEIAEEQRHGVETMVGEVAGRFAPFTLRLDRVGAFPSLGAPRVIWVGLGGGTESVGRLAEAIERGGAAMGLRQEARPFSAHVTIGRVRSPRRREALVQRLQETPWDAPPPWRVTSVTFYQSVLSPAGPTYTVLAEIPLGPRV